jgi:hypothetical protein
MEREKIVVRYKDGRVVKGSTTDFDENRPQFQVEREGLDPVHVWIPERKAVFFVRDFRGDPQRRERKEFLPTEVPRRFRVEVTLADGEILVGHTMTQNVRERLGFFLTPVDPRSNNIRVFVVTNAVQSVRFF